MSTPARTGITLVLGPANSGKMGRVLDWWQERLPHRPLVVLPTAPDALQATAEMAQRMGGLVGQDPAVTFDGLVRHGLGRSPRYATELERTLILSGLLRGLPVRALGGAGRRPSLAPSVGALLQQLSESGRSPEEIDEVMQRWASLDPEVAALSTDLRELAAGLFGECSRLGLTDRPSVLREALAVASTWRRPVAFYGFTSFTAGQRDLIEALSRSAEVLVVFTHRPEHAVGLTRLDELAWWTARAGDVVEAQPDTRSYAAPEIAYLERYLASEGPRPGPPPAGSDREGVRFILASGRRAEAEAAAERIAELLRAGLRPADIGVVVRQVGPWRRLLRDVFDSCGISHHMDDRCLVGETGLGHAFLGALKGVAYDDDSGLLGYLRSPYSGLAPEEIADLELRYRRGAYRGARALVGAADQGERDSFRRLWDLVVPEAADIAAGVAAAGGSGPGGPSGAAGPGIDPVAAVALAERMLVAGAAGATPGSRDLQEDARAFRVLRTALQTIGVYAAGRDAGGGLDFPALLRVLAGAGVPSAGGDGGDSVQVLSAQRARARRFDTVLVLGLVEGEFPGRPDLPSLLSSAQRTRLDRLGGGLFAPETDQEEALFVSAASRARRLLYLSARDAEDDGGEATPSRFWHSAKGLLGRGAGEHEARTLAELAFSPHVAPSARHYLRGCAATGAAPERAGEERAHDTPPAFRLGLPRLADPAVLEELAALDCFSPSALESYLACPFAWFVERVVGVDELESDLDAKSQGVLLHLALSATFRELDRRGWLPLRTEGLPSAERVALDAVDDAVQSERCPGTYALKRLAACRLKGMVRALLAAEAGAGGAFISSQTETWVGGRQGVDVGGLRVKGCIDRIDATAAGPAVFIIDYKSGKTPAASALGTGEGLQLPLYLMALRAERPDVRVTGGAYLSLAESRRVGVVAAEFKDALGAGSEGCQALSEDAMAELYERTLAVAQAAASGMREGAIAPRPDRKCPPWCRLGPACRSGRGGYRP